MTCIHLVLEAVAEVADWDRGNRIAAAVVAVAAAEELDWPILRTDSDSGSAGIEADFAARRMTAAEDLRTHFDSLVRQQVKLDVVDSSAEAAVAVAVVVVHRLDFGIAAAVPLAKPVDHSADTALAGIAGRTLM